MPQRSLFDRPSARRPFDPNNRCFECDEKGHYAYNCHHYGRLRRNRSRSASLRRSGYNCIKGSRYFQSRSRSR
uniref:CCHC-type domain-containing protein n=1 Tax=Castor canadensis TaxID=51338 RepID=A0A8C0W4P9_CASCN